jgi:hypothetical protein
MAGEMDLFHRSESFASFGGGQQGHDAAMGDGQGVVLQHAVCRVHRHYPAGMDQRLDRLHRL